MRNTDIYITNHARYTLDSLRYINEQALAQQYDSYKVNDVKFIPTVSSIRLWICFRFR